MSKITHLKGDLFQHLPILSQKPIAICHIVNNIGAWGSGFVIPLGKYFPDSQKYYHNYHHQYELGDVQRVNDHFNDGLGSVAIMNMFAQDGILSKSTGDRSKVNAKPIRYSALCKCLEEVNEQCVGYDIYAPKFGSGLAGGNWELIEELIDEILVDVSSIYIFSL